MRKAKSGDRITVHYIGTIDNGRIFDQRDADEPLSFTLGGGEVFPALEMAIVGMAEGEVKNIHLPADLAYGPHRAENLLKLARSMFPKNREPRVGEKLAIELGGDEQRVMRVVRVGEHEVMLDGNHPLAGCNLTFALQLVRISDQGDPALAGDREET